MRSLVVAAALSLAAGHAAAQSSCGQYDFAGPYAEAFLAGEEFEGAAKAAETITTMADGACHQDQLVERLEEGLGPISGYKAAATSAGAQRQLGLDGPVLGVLFEDMLRPAGSTIAIDEGARLIFELDLLARVGDEAINQATTREEALSAIDAFVPFVELGDLMVPKGAAITGPLLQAMNAGARLGVTGDPLPTDGLTVEDVAAAAGSLARNGSVVAEAPATALLGHPLEAVLWIANEAKARGWQLEEGDVLSLGSMGRFQLAAPGEITATYQGLSTEPATLSFTLE
jgi:2-oxo-hept-3-ene-1,7-dioate hydratase